MWRKSIQVKILEKLGEGSQGEVYKALRLDPGSRLNQIVALKVLHSKTAVDLWRQEFESLSSVRSLYCVRVLSFERHLGRPALILEYVEGLSLSAIAQSCCLELDDIAEVLAQIEAGLNDLHRAGVVHGDLSPHNIMIDIHGQVKLLDFGLANCCANTPRMTPEFSAPERLTGAAPDTKSDFFSLGRVEEFLVGSHITDSVYLTERRDRGLESQPTRAHGLGEKVRALRWRLRTVLSTQTLSPPIEAGKPKIFYALNAVALCAMLLFLSKASSGSNPLLPAQLRIHTKYWHSLALNGRALGYAPITLLLEANQTQNLTWASARGSGARHIRLRPGESLELSDSDFSH